MHLRVVRLKDSLLQLSESQFTALGQLLPSLLCGEESSFHVSGEKGIEARMFRSVIVRLQLIRLPSKNWEHERLLQDLRRLLPRAQPCCEGLWCECVDFFLRMASRDPAVHFARVAALDSGVCVILSSLVQPLSRATALVEIFNRIRSDEARHVRFSARGTRYELWGRHIAACEYRARIRGELVALLYPLGNSFEDLGLMLTICFAGSTCRTVA